MAKAAFNGFLKAADLTVTLLIVLYLIFSTINLCIKTPLSSLVAVGILAIACASAYCLVNVKRWITQVKIVFSRPSYSYKATNTFRHGAAADRVSHNDDDLNYKAHGKIDGHKNAHHSFLGGISSDIPIRRSAFSFEHLSNLSQQPFPLSANDVRYFSFNSDHGRRNQCSRAPEDISFRERFFDRLAFYSYFDPDFQKHSGFQCLRWFAGFNYWLKHRWIKPLLHNAVWIVSGIIVTVAWCIVWEWAACYMQRDEGNYNLLHWSVELVPNSYWILEGAFQLIFCLNYLIQLYDNDVRCKYIFSLRGFIDLTMTSALTQTMAWISTYLNIDSVKYDSLNHFGLLFFGPLRFLKLTQAEELLNISFDHLSDVQTIIIGIATAAVSLLFSFSGMMYLLEAPRESVNFVCPFDFIFFGVATMGTVGYGDFVPITKTGRALSILLICTCISLGAVHFKRLKEAISRNVIDMGSRFDLSGYKYVLFWGPLSAYQVLTFCRCVANSFDGVLDTVIVATPLPLESYRLVYCAVKRNTGINLCIIGGSEKICAPSSVYKFIGLSMLTVVVNNMETETHEDHNVDDQMTILRSIACLNITRHLGIPVGVQLHGSDYASFLNSSDITQICYLRELKYKLIAKSVTCRGLFYLILTLFHTPTNMKRTRAYVEDLYNLFATSNEEEEEPPKQNARLSLQEVTHQLFEIITGMKFQLYKLAFPLCTHGLKFLELCQYLYKVKNIFLLGIVSKDRCVLNPVDYVIGQQDEVVWHGLVLAKSLRDVLHVSMIKNPILDLLPIKVSETVSAPQLGNINAILELTETMADEHKRMDRSMFNGIFKVDDWEQAMQCFAEPRGNLILVCGWLHDMHNFLKYLLSDNTSNVICLAPLDIATSDCPMSLTRFRKFVTYIDGSAMDANSLLIAGVAKATCIVVLNSEQVCSSRRNKQLSKDSQVLFVGHLIKKIFASPSEVLKPPHVILDIQHSSCLEYLDPSLVSSMEASCGRDAMNRLWQNFGEFMTSYEMASGTIFVQDMLYGLLAHSYIPSFNSVGYDTIQQILDGDTDSNVSNNICLDELPLDLSGATFENLFKRKLFLEQKICIGILRTYTTPIVNGEQKQLIIVAPQPAFILHNDDQVYVVWPNHMN